MYKSVAGMDGAGMRRSYYQIVLDCMDVLEQWIDGEQPRIETKILLEEMYERTTKRTTGGKLINHGLTVRYEDAKAMIASGSSIGSACAMAGITRDQFNRRRRIEAQGRDRQERRSY